MDKYLKFAMEHGLFYDRYYHPDNKNWGITVRSEYHSYRFYYSNDVVDLKIQKESDIYTANKEIAEKCWKKFKQAIEEK